MEKFTLVVQTNCIRLMQAGNSLTRDCGGNMSVHESFILKL